MQPNSIILPVDKLNTGVTTDETFGRYDEYQNRTIYTGDGHSLSSDNKLTMYRTFPKPSGNFKGVGKSSYKFTKDFTVLGVDGLAQLTAPLIVEVNFSIPVGISDADVLEARQRALALLDIDTIMDDLNIGLVI